MLTLPNLQYQFSVIWDYSLCCLCTTSLGCFEDALRIAVYRNTFGNPLLLHENVSYPTHLISDDQKFCSYPFRYVQTLMYMHTYMYECVCVCVCFLPILLRGYNLRGELILRGIHFQDDFSMDIPKVQSVLRSDVSKVFFFFLIWLTAYQP